jgi:hypothetical protein
VEAPLSGRRLPWQTAALLILVVSAALWALILQGLSWLNLF